MPWQLGGQALGQLKFCCGCHVWVLCFMAVALFFEEETHKAVNVTKSHVLRP